MKTTLHYDMWIKALLYLVLIVLAAWIYSVQADCMTVHYEDMEFINCDNGYNSTIIRSDDLILDSHGNSAIIMGEDDDSRLLQDYLITDDEDLEALEYDDWLEQ